MFDSYLLGADRESRYGTFCSAHVFRIFLTECPFSFASAISVLNVRAISYLL